MRFTTTAVPMTAANQMAQLLCLPTQRPAWLPGPHRTRVSSRHLTQASHLPQQRFNKQRCRLRLAATAGSSCHEEALAPTAEPAARSQQLQHQTDALSAVMERLEAAGSLRNRIAALQQEPAVKEFLRSSRLGHELLQELVSLPPEEAYVILCLPAMRQEHVLTAPPEPGTTFRAALRKLASTLAAVEAFYGMIGGVLGYQHKCLQIMLEAERGGSEDSQQQAAALSFHMPRGPNLAAPSARAITAESAATGLEALPHMAEIYPLGGAGDRLGLKCDVTGEALPVAVLPYCGRPLLESLIRDVQAREYLCYKLTGVQHMTPIVIMTSDAKGNHVRVTQFMEQCNWFGRGRNSFRLFRQPLVPVVSAEDGRWLLPEGVAPMLKPGGHGAVWKLMLDGGVFDWLSHQEREAAIVRQISNPLAGTDATLLSLSGSGYTDSRSFGFASCPRVVGAAEGMNVLLERRARNSRGEWEHSYNVTNVEYTEFERMGIQDVPKEPGSPYSRFPANTNVLYVNLKAAEAAVRAGVERGGGAAMPGMIFNMNKRISFRDAATGEQRSVNAGRMECTMQNLVDSLAQRFREPVPLERHSELNTFVVYNQRSRVTSSAKRRREPGSTRIHQTPDGSFLDLQRNARDMLLRCGFEVPEVPDVADYLASGPSFVALHHPALGPLWDTVAQKLRGGRLAPRSELVLEVAEAAVTNLCVEGSLLVEADAPIGQVEASLSVNYSQVRSRRDMERRRRPRDGEGTSPGVPLERELTWFTSQQTRQRAPPAPRTLVYSNRCGRVRLDDVTVCNAGIDWEHPETCWWQHRVHRREALRIRLHGNAEFEAANVVLEGDRTFEVPDGHRMVVSSGPGGSCRTALFPLAEPTWQWRYSMGERGAIHLDLLEAADTQQAPASSMEPDSFTYMI